MRNNKIAGVYDLQMICEAFIDNIGQATPPGFFEMIGLGRKLCSWALLSFLKNGFLAATILHEASKTYGSPEGSDPSRRSCANTLQDFFCFYISRTWQ